MTIRDPNPVPRLAEGRIRLSARAVVLAFWVMFGVAGVMVG